MRAGFWRASNARRRAKRKAEVRSPKLAGSGRQGWGEQSLSGVRQLTALGKGAARAPPPLPPCLLCRGPNNAPGASRNNGSAADAPAIRGGGRICIQAALPFTSSVLAAPGTRGLNTRARASVHVAPGELSRRMSMNGRGQRGTVNERAARGRS